MNHSNNMLQHSSITLSCIKRLKLKDKRKSQVCAHRTERICYQAECRLTGSTKSTQLATMHLVTFSSTAAARRHKLPALVLYFMALVLILRASPAHFVEATSHIRSVWLSADSASGSGGGEPSVQARNWPSADATDNMQKVSQPEQPAQRRLGSALDESSSSLQPAIVSLDETTSSDAPSSHLMTTSGGGGGSERRRGDIASSSESHNSDRRLDSSGSDTSALLDADSSYMQMADIMRLLHNNRSMHGDTFGVNQSPTPMSSPNQTNNAQVQFDEANDGHNHNTSDRSMHSLAGGALTHPSSDSIDSLFSSYDAHENSANSQRRLSSGGDLNDTSSLIAQHHPPASDSPLNTSQPMDLADALRLQQEQLDAIDKLNAGMGLPYDNISKLTEADFVAPPPPPPPSTTPSTSTTSTSTTQAAITPGRLGSLPTSTATPPGYQMFYLTDQDMSTTPAGGNRPLQQVSAVADNNAPTNRRKLHSQGTQYDMRDAPLQQRPQQSDLGALHALEPPALNLHGNAVQAPTLADINQAEHAFQSKRKRAPSRSQPYLQPMQPVLDYTQYNEASQAHFAPKRPHTSEDAISESFWATTPAQSYDAHRTVSSRSAPPLIPPGYALQEAYVYDPNQYGKQVPLAVVTAPAIQTARRSTQNVVPLRRAAPANGNARQQPQAQEQPNRKLQLRPSSFVAAPSQRLMTGGQLVSNANTKRKRASLLGSLGHKLNNWVSGDSTRAAQHLENSFYETIPPRGELSRPYRGPPPPPPLQPVVASSRVPKPVRGAGAVWPPPYHYYAGPAPVSVPLTPATVAQAAPSHASVGEEYAADRPMAGASAVGGLIYHPHEPPHDASQPTYVGQVQQPTVAPAPSALDRFYDSVPPHSVQSHRRRRHPTRSHASSSHHNHKHASDPDEPASAAAPNQRPAQQPNFIPVVAVSVTKTSPAPMLNRPHNAQDDEDEGNHGNRATAEQQHGPAALPPELDEYLEMKTGVPRGNQHKQVTYDYGNLASGSVRNQQQQRNNRLRQQQQQHQFQQQAMNAHGQHTTTVKSAVFGYLPHQANGPLLHALSMLPAVSANAPHSPESDSASGSSQLQTAAASEPPPIQQLHAISVDEPPPSLTIQLQANNFAQNDIMHPFGPAPHEQRRPTHQQQQQQQLDQRHQYHLIDAASGAAHSHANMMGSLIAAGPSTDEQVRDTAHLLAAATEINPLLPAALMFTTANGAVAAQQPHAYQAAYVHPAAGAERYQQAASSQHHQYVDPAAESSAPPARHSASSSSSSQIHTKGNKKRSSEFFASAGQLLLSALPLLLAPTLGLMFAASPSAAAAGAGGSIARLHGLDQLQNASAAPNSVRPSGSIAHTSIPGSYINGIGADLLPLNANAAPQAYAQPAYNGSTAHVSTTARPQMYAGVAQSQNTKHSTASGVMTALGVRATSTTTSTRMPYANVSYVHDQPGGNLLPMTTSSPSLTQPIMTTTPQPPAQSILTDAPMHSLQQQLTVTLTTLSPPPATYQIGNETVAHAYLLPVAHQAHPAHDSERVLAHAFNRTPSSSHNRHNHTTLYLIAHRAPPATTAPPASDVDVYADELGGAQMHAAAHSAAPASQFHNSPTHNVELEQRRGGGAVVNASASSGPLAVYASNQNNEPNYHVGYEGADFDAQFATLRRNNSGAHVHESVAAHNALENAFDLETAPARQSSPNRTTFYRFESVNNTTLSPLPPATAAAVVAPHDKNRYQYTGYEPADLGAKRRPAQLSESFNTRLKTNVTLGDNASSEFVTEQPQLFPVSTWPLSRRRTVSLMTSSGNRTLIDVSDRYKPSVDASSPSPLANVELSPLASNALRSPDHLREPSLDSDITMAASSSSSSDVALGRHRRDIDSSPFEQPPESIQPAAQNTTSSLQAVETNNSTSQALDNRAPAKPMRKRRRSKPRRTNPRTPANNSTSESLATAQSSMDSNSSEGAERRQGDARPTESMREDATRHKSAHIVTTTTITRNTNDEDEPSPLAGDDGRRDDAGEDAAAVAADLRQHLLGKKALVERIANGHADNITADEQPALHARGNVHMSRRRTGVNSPAAPHVQQHAAILGDVLINDTLHVRHQDERSRAKPPSGNQRRVSPPEPQTTSATERSIYASYRPMGHAHELDAGSQYTAMAHNYGPDYRPPNTYHAPQHSYAPSHRMNVPYNASQSYSDPSDYAPHGPTADRMSLIEPHPAYNSGVPMEGDAHYHSGHAYATPGSQPLDSTRSSYATTSYSYPLNNNRSDEFSTPLNYSRRYETTNEPPAAGYMVPGDSQHSNYDSTTYQPTSSPPPPPTNDVYYYNHAPSSSPPQIISGRRDSGAMYHEPARQYSPQVPSGAYADHSGMQHNNMLHGSYMSSGSTVSPIPMSSPPPSYMRSMHHSAQNASMHMGAHYGPHDDYGYIGPQPHSHSQPAHDSAAMYPIQTPHAHNHHHEQHQQHLPHNHNTAHLSAHHTQFAQFNNNNNRVPMASGAVNRALEPHELGNFPPAPHNNNNNEYQMPSRFARTPHAPPVESTSAYSASSLFQPSAQQLGDRAQPGSSGADSRTVNEYLKRVQFSDSDRDKLMASYLTCDGLLNDNDHCLERLSCEFSDPQNIEKANKLDRAVSSILLGHILINTYIPDQFKLRLKSASLFGYTHSGKCSRFVCNKLTRPGRSSS